MCRRVSRNLSNVTAHKLCGMWEREMCNGRKEEKEINILSVSWCQTHLHKGASKPKPIARADNVLRKTSAQTQPASADRLVRWWKCEERSFREALREEKNFQIKKNYFLWWKILKAERHTKCHHHTKTFIGARAPLKEDRKIISRYCKEIVGFLFLYIWESFAFTSWKYIASSSTNTQLTTPLHISRRIDEEKPKSETPTQVCRKTQRSARFFTVSTLCRCDGFGSTSDDFVGKIFYFSFVFSSFRFVVFFSLVFSVQLVISSLTHDVPWMLLRAFYRWFFILFSHFFLLDQVKKGKNERELRVKLSGYCSRCQWTIGSDC